MVHKFTSYQYLKSVPLKDEFVISGAMLLHLSELIKGNNFTLIKERQQRVYTIGAIQFNSLMLHSFLLSNSNSLFLNFFDN